MRRRDLLLHLVPALGAGTLHAQNAARPQPLTRAIPSSGEHIPVVGLGSWITFNVGNDRPARNQCTEVMRHFFEAGGRLIDSSPMYGSSQGVIGEGLQKLQIQSKVISAEKVWTSSDGAAQIEQRRGHPAVPVGGADRRAAMDPGRSFCRHAGANCAGNPGPGAGKQPSFAATPLGAGRHSGAVLAGGRRNPLDFIHLKLSP